MFGLTTRGQLDPATQLEFERLYARLTEFLSVSFDEDGTLNIATPDTREVGEVIEFAGPNPPSDKWLPCDGAAVSRVTYKTLYERLGTTHGIGDGSTTFNLPDCRGRFTLCKASSGTGSLLGETGGAIDHTHTMGAHTHDYSGNSTTGSNGGFSTSTNSAGEHDHGGSTGADPAQATVQIDAGGPDPVSVSIGPHVHGISNVSAHSHTVSVGDHTHSYSWGGTTTSSAGGDTGSANPPYIVLNKFIYTGVSA